MKNKKYVAFLDILGFSNFILNNDLEKVVEKLDKLLAVNLFVTGEENNSEPKNKFDIYLHKIGFILLSDSIILYTKDDSFESLKNIVEATSKILLNGINHKLPLRGAITCGELFVNEKEKTNQQNVLQQIYGKALVKAHQLEGTQNWSGCIIDNEIIEKLNYNEEFSYIYEKNNYILKYNVPLKICNKDYYVVNWIKDKNSISKIRLEQAFYEDETKVNDSVKIKFCNTLKFYEWVVENSRFIDNLSSEQSK